MADSSSRKTGRSMAVQEPKLQLDRRRRPTLRERSSWRNPSLFTILLLLIACIAQISLPRPDLTQYLGPTSPNVLILTAHPDDECMFFAPIILALVEQGIPVRALSLSTGNSSGLGEIRRKELFDSYAVLGLGSHSVQALDHDLLQDGMDQPWDPAHVADALRSHPNISSITTIITFDHGGITQHPNHTPLSAGVRSLDLHPISLITLETVPIYIKFTGPLYPLVLKAVHLLSEIPIFESTFGQREGKLETKRLTVTSTLRGYRNALDAMRQHESQLVWFRWLYVGASKYMWSNTLVLADPS